MPRKPKSLNNEEKALTKPQLLVQNTRAYQVFDYIVQGYTAKEIAVKMGVTEQYIHKIISEESARITVAMEDLKSRYVTVMLAKTEYLGNRLFQRVLEALDVGEIPNRDIMKALQDVWKFQKDIAMPDNGKTVVEDNSRNLTINQTLSAGSDLYDSALQNLQQDLAGYTIHNVDMPTVIELPPKLLDLEALAIQYYPEGLDHDGESEPA